MSSIEQTISNPQETLFLHDIPEGTITIQKDAHLTLIVVATHGDDKKHTLRIKCEGQGSSVKFFGFIIGQNNSSFNFETISDHTAQNTIAHYHLRAALFDQSQVDYKGNLILNKQAQLADTYLAHHTLLLSDKAHARTIPALEIEADDVKAGHAATIGRVNKEDLFYLLSRGLDSNKAQQILILAFFEAQISMIKDESLQEKIRGELVKTLPFATEI